MTSDPEKVILVLVSESPLIESSCILPALVKLESLKSKVPVTSKLPPTLKLAPNVTSPSASRNTALPAGSVQNIVLLPDAKSILVVFPADVSITGVRASVAGEASVTVPIPNSHVPSVAGAARY